jgi:hypothetical protein
MVPAGFAAKAQAQMAVADKTEPATTIGTAVLRLNHDTLSSRVGGRAHVYGSAMKGLTLVAAASHQRRRQCVVIDLRLVRASYKPLRIAAPFRRD